MKVKKIGTAGYLLFFVCLIFLFCAHMIFTDRKNLDYQVFVEPDFFVSFLFVPDTGQFFQAGETIGYGDLEKSVEIIQSKDHITLDHPYHDISIGLKGKANLNFQF